jgi:hypothetical protein
MICDGSLDMAMTADLASGGDMLVVMHVYLKDGADKKVVGRRLLAKRSFQDQYIRTHSNLPDLLAWVFWSSKITEVRRILKEVSADEDVRSAMVNFAYLERMYPTWRDKLLNGHARVNTNGYNRASAPGLKKKRHGS